MLELIDYINKHAVKHGDFTLSSGAKSTYFIDMSEVTLRSTGLNLICNEIIKVVNWGEIDAVGGPVLGACPIVSGLVMDLGMRGFFIRKEPKNGSYYIEGTLQPFDRVLIVEDVVTTGAQTARAIEIVQEAYAGIEVRAVVAVVDRLAGATFKNYKSLVTVKDLNI